MRFSGSTNGIGATVSLMGDPFVGLFSESAGRAIVTVPEDRLDSFVTMAASLGVPAMTAYWCLYADGPLTGQTVLIAGGAGAVGHFAIELAKHGGAQRT